MRTRFIAIPLALLLALPVVSSTGLTKKDKSTLHDAVVVLDALTSAPDKGIPQELLAKADCILIFPSVAKGALIVGGVLPPEMLRADDLEIGGGISASFAAAGPREEDG